MAEIGMIAQNVYFDANALDLATITTGMSVNDLYELDLPSNEKPEIIMHLGHPPTPYDFTYNPLPQSNLPSRGQQHADIGGSGQHPPDRHTHGTPRN